MLHVYIDGCDTGYSKGTTKKGLKGGNDTEDEAISPVFKPPYN